MTAPASFNAVELHGVWKRYGSHVAVRDLSLIIPTGTVYALLGPNGAGKTSTIRMLLDLIAPDEGEIRVLGQPPNTPNLTDRIGYLPEERGLYRKMGVREILRFLAALKGIERFEADLRIEWWLEHFELVTFDKDWGDSRVEELSRGMQQKVQFISAVLHDPDLIILDEPFTGLDPVNTQVLYETILDLRDQGKTIVLSTHILANAESMCDAACIIARGEKILDGTISDIKIQYGGPAVERTIFVQPSLHEIFLQQVGGIDTTRRSFTNARGLPEFGND